MGMTDLWSIFMPATGILPVAGISHYMHSAQHTHIQLVDVDSEANTEPSKMTTTQLTELHANSSFFKRCLVSLSGGSLIR